MVSILLVNAAISTALFVLGWRIANRIGDPSFIDSWWALGIVVLASCTFVQVPPSAHALVLFVLTTAWGLRLGLYLLRRWLDHGKDRRYAALEGSAREKHRLSFSAFAALWVFAPQMVLQFAVALPAMAGMLTERSALGWLAWFGLTVAAAGIAYQAFADWQLARFKADPANAGRVMDQGLWRYSRHPNYFGELCVWWGMYAIAADSGHPLLTLIGPVLLTFLLTRVSGAPTTEPHLQKTRPDYEAYKARTSAFIPWPPAARTAVSVERSN